MDKPPITNAEIVQFWRFADLGYQSAADLKALFGTQITTFDIDHDGVGDVIHVIQLEGVVWIVAAGSDDKLDWINNANADAVGGLHQGFLDEVLQFGRDIIDYVKSLKPSAVYMTGHSRGGADVDMLLEVFGKTLDAAGITCITFAQPRIATAGYYRRNGSMKDAANVRYLRVAFGNDEVPHLPPSRFGYVHHGPSLILGERLGWWARLRLSLRRSWREKKFSLETERAHRRPRYRKMAKELEEGLQNLPIDNTMRSIRQPDGVVNE